MHEVATQSPVQPASGAGNLTVVFDGECPVCTAYSCSIAADGANTIVNARDGGELVEQLTAQGFDLDEGMAVIHDGKVFHGSEAIRIMALHGPRHGMLGRLNHVVFRSAARSRFLYPILRSGRNLLLRMLGRRKLNAPERD